MARKPDNLKTLTVALAGNPNSGKTTVFNNLTGARQRIANYPGVTVEKKEGVCRRGSVELSLVDLPGIYSLTAYSTEELVARDFLLNERPDVVVNVLDASNLERNLYLTVQLIELGVPLVLVLNMSDVAKARGIEFDLGALSRFFGAPLIPAVGHKQVGMTEVVDAILAAGEQARHASMAGRVKYGREVEEELSRIEALLVEERQTSSRTGVRWQALKLLEGDSEVDKEVTSARVHQAVEHSRAHLTHIFGDSPEMVIPDRRYGFISGACQEAVRSTVEARHTRSDRIDAVLLNRVFGLPIFLALMYLVFQLTFAVGRIPMVWIERVLQWLSGAITRQWPTGAEGPLLSLVVDGIIGGVGGVIVFVPVIMLLFLGISILEDSGYMARAAFIMDQLMHRIGLHGKSFIPMLIGFGCSVPAIMATRTLEGRRDRITTILILPLMSCGARLPIYALFIPAFFPERWHGPMLWLIYVIGIVLAIALANVLRATVLQGETTPFVMELPPYRLPTLRGVVVHMWERAWLYLKKAGTVILGFSVVLWALTTYPRKQAFDQDYAQRAQVADASYRAAVLALNSAAGLPAEAEALFDALSARDIAEDSGVLPADTPDGVLRFFRLDRDMQRIRDTYDHVLPAELPEALDLGVLAALRQRDDDLAVLARGDPELFAAVSRYRDTILPAHAHAVRAIAAEKQAEEMAYSIAGRVGCGLEPALKPLGFDWRIGTALIGAFAAKEVFVAQLGIVFAVGDAEANSEALRQQLRTHYRPLVGFCVMVFCLITYPCIATVVVCRRETASWRWAAFQLFGLTGLAYVVTLLVYQVGSMLGG